MQRARAVDELLGRNTGFCHPVSIFTSGLEDASGRLMKQRVCQRAAEVLVGQNEHRGHPVSFSVSRWRMA